MTIQDTIVEDMPIPTQPPGRPLGWVLTVLGGLLALFSIGYPIYGFLRVLVTNQIRDVEFWRYFLLGMVMGGVVVTLVIGFVAAVFLVVGIWLLTRKPVIHPMDLEDRQEPDLQ